MRGGGELGVGKFRQKLQLLSKLDKRKVFKIEDRDDGGGMIQGRKIFEIKANTKK